MPATDHERFEERWREICARPAEGRISLLVVRVGNGEHETPQRVELSVEGGVHGDRWGRESAGDPEGQVSLIDRRVVETIAGLEPRWLHLPGDNVVVDLALDEASLPVGTRLRLGSAVIEITAKLHAGCSKFRARMGDEPLRWINAAPNRARRLRGVFARVVASGTVAVGDQIVRI